MIIMEMMQLAEKVGSVKSALLPMLVIKQKMHSLQRKDIFQEFSIFSQNPWNRIRLQAFLKSYLALRCKQINKRFVYHERNNCRDISSSLPKSSVNVFLYSRIREYDQITPVLIDSEDTDVVIMCAYAASIINPLSAKFIK